MKILPVIMIAAAIAGITLFLLGYPIAATVAIAVQLICLAAIGAGIQDEARNLFRWHQAFEAPTIDIEAEKAWRSRMLRRYGHLMVQWPAMMDYYRKAGRQAAEAELESLDKRHAELNSMPRNTDWLFASLYDYVCAYHDGDGQVMDAFNRRARGFLADGKTPKEVWDMVLSQRW